MSIENGITKLAEAINTIAQSGFALAASIDRYCDITQDQAVSTAPDAEMKEAISKAVAEFEAEHDAHKAEVKTEEAEPVVAEEAAPVVEEAEAPEEVAEAQNDEPVSFEEAKTVVIDAVAAKGKPAVAAIFAKLGAKNLPGLEPSQYGKLVALCKAA